MKISKKYNDHAARYWKPLENTDSNVVCLLCPQNCRLSPDEEGKCLVRVNRSGELVSVVYGVTNGLALDPIEKKPLYHFYPGSSVLSFGTAGCNLTCSFCQNWSLSKTNEIRTSSMQASPGEICRQAAELGAKSVAYTYNDPIVFIEYACDTAVKAREKGIYNVAVSNGFINKKPAKDLFGLMDAANIDLKSFSDSFYETYAGAKLGPVLNTLSYIREQTNVWLEITTLIIPGLNDSIRELMELSAWVFENLGANTPLHFSAFFPNYHMQNIRPTPVETLIQAREIALESGLKYVYIGNAPHRESTVTRCHNCAASLIERRGYKTAVINLQNGHCGHCGESIPGRF